MFYLADLLVVMTDGLKIVRIRAPHVPRVHGHKRLDDDASLAPEKWRCRVLYEPGRRPVETHKKSSQDNLRMSGSGL